MMARQKRRDKIGKKREEFGRMTRIVAIIALACVTVPGIAHAHLAVPQHPAPPAITETPSFPKSMVGTWRARPERVPLSDDNGWGRNATSVRLAELRIAANGTGSVTVTRSVVNRAGAAFPGSRVTETADFTIGPEEHPAGLRPHYATTLTKTSRRYQDPPFVRSTIEGLTLNLFAPAADQPDSIEIDFMLFIGDGSFSDKLQRVTR
jgi:hypothetical protein